MKISAESVEYISRFSTGKSKKNVVSVLKDIFFSIKVTVTRDLDPISKNPPLIFQVGPAVNSGENFGRIGRLHFEIFDRKIKKKKHRFGT